MLPIGFELGFGGSNLLQSGNLCLNGYAKIALHEGYHDIPVPSIAARATVSRLAGTPQVDMTITPQRPDVQSVWHRRHLHDRPNIGGGAIWSIVRSQSLTPPNIDCTRGQPPGMTTVSAAFTGPKGGLPDAGRHLPLARVLASTSTTRSSRSTGVCVRRCGR